MLAVGVLPGRIHRPQSRALKANAHVLSKLARDGKWAFKVDLGRGVAIVPRSMMRVRPEHGVPGPAATSGAVWSLGKSPSDV